MAAEALKEVVEMQDLAEALFLEKVYPALLSGDPQTWNFLRHRLRVCAQFLHQAQAQVEKRGGHG